MSSEKISELTQATVVAVTDEAVVNVSGNTRRVPLSSIRGATGTVSGTYAAPTGALMETGTGATGRFYRYADGSQRCEHALALNQISTVSLQGVWVFPAAFVAAPTGFSAILTSTSVQAASFGVQEISSTLRGTTTATQVIFSTFLAPGASADPADTLTLIVTAHGRWLA